METNSNSKSWLTIILIISLILNGALSAITLTLYRKDKQLTGTINMLTENITRNSETLNSLLSELNYTKQQLNYYNKTLNYYMQLVQRGSGNFSIIGESKVNVVAVKVIQQDYFTVKYVGVTMYAEIELTSGDGKILINTTPKIGIDLQSSVNTAVLVAEEYTNVSLQNSNVIVSVHSNEPVSVVDGPSAGAAITTAIIAAILDVNLNSSIYLTGTINADGSVGSVGGVLEKSIAAAEAGGKIFLVPQGESKVTIRKAVEREIAPGFKIITYTYETVDLKDYLQNAGYNLQVIEVKDIGEVCSYLLQEKSS